MYINIPNINNQKQNIENISNWDFYHNNYKNEYIETTIDLSNDCIIDINTSILLCLKTLMYNNKDVLFKYWLYNEEEYKKLIILTDKQIDISSWNQLIDNKMDNLEDIINEMSKPHTDDNNIISVYDIFTFINSIYQTKNNIDLKYNSIIRAINQNKGLNVKLHKIQFVSDSRIDIIVDDNRLRIYKDDIGWHSISRCDNNLSKLLGYIAPYFDQYVQESLFYDNLQREINHWPVDSINSKLIVDIDFKKTITLQAITNNDLKLFSTNINNTNKYEYHTGYPLLLNKIIGHEEEILKNIYVDIKKMPIWMQNYLKKIRQDELAKPKYVENIPQEEIKKNEKQKRKSLFKRLFK